MQKVLARIKNPDIEIEDHGFLVLTASIETEKGSFGGFGYQLDMVFLRGFMGAVGVRSLKQLHGKSFWLVYSGEPSVVITMGLVAIEPLHKSDGVVFSIKDWVEGIRKEELCKK